MQCQMTAENRLNRYTLVECRLSIIVVQCPEKLCQFRCRLLLIIFQSKNQHRSVHAPMLRFSISKVVRTIDIIGCFLSTEQFTKSVTSTDFNIHILALSISTRKTDLVELATCVLQSLFVSFETMPTGSSIMMHVWVSSAMFCDTFISVS